MFGLQYTITTFSRFMPEEPCGGACKVEFEGLVFLVTRICRLVPLFNCQPHLFKTVTLHHLADVCSTIRYNCEESGVEIGLAKLERKVMKLSEMLPMDIDSNCWSPVLAVGIVEKFLLFRNCLGEDGLLAGN